MSCLHRSGALAIAAGLAGGTTPVLGDEAPNLLETPFHLAFGTFVVHSRPAVRLDGQTDTGTPIDWEGTFGRRYPSRVRLDGRWRFADRHKARVSAFESRSDSRRTIKEDIVWDGETYPANATVDARREFLIVEVAYEYAVRRRESHEVSASFGLHYTEFDASLRSKAELSGGVLTEDLAGSGRFGAPLPVIGLSGLWSLPHHLWIDATVQYFALSIDEYHGGLQNYRVLLNWQPRKWLGIGIGYSRFSMDVDLDTDDFNGSLDWIYDGPLVFYSASF